MGRAVELSRLRLALDRARSGQGGLLMLVGEPGIGKSRTIEEFGAACRRAGVTVLSGRCYEGEWAPPYRPFVEAVGEHVRTTEPATLRKDLGYGGASLARLVPAIREVLPDLPEPAALRADEERFRIFDATSQFLIGLAARRPVILVLDDLHWADTGTLAMLRHVVRFASKERMLILGAYRDVELDRQHPMAAALLELRREAEYERIPLNGLTTDEIAALLRALAERELPDSLVQAVEVATDGNPFFVREVLLHLAETGNLRQEDGSWRTDFRAEELGIPEGVREVVGLRLSRLSDLANRLLSTASACNGPFRFDVVAKAAGAPDLEALDALDEALLAKLIEPAGPPETYKFSHANIRDVLYSELNSSRQVRMHRILAEKIEELAGDVATEHAADLAYHYHRSAQLAGTDRGFEYALVAADRAAASYAWEQVGVFLRMAEELLPTRDGRRAKVLARLGLALPWAGRGEEAHRVALAAARLIADQEGASAAGWYLAEACLVVSDAGFTRLSWELAQKGLEYCGEDRDSAWVRLRYIELQGLRAEHPERGWSAEYAALRQVARSLPEPEQPLPQNLDLWRPPSRLEGISLVTALTAAQSPWAGLLLKDYEVGLASAEGVAPSLEEQGRLRWAIVNLSFACRYAGALGELQRAVGAYRRAAALLARTAGVGDEALYVGAAGELLRCALGSPPRETELVRWETFLATSEHGWAFGVVRAMAAAAHSQLGRAERATELLTDVVEAVDRDNWWTTSYDLLVWCAVETLWRLDHRAHTETLRQSIFEKIVEPDWAAPGSDGRLEMARLYALERRLDEAHEWFERARHELDQLGARTLRAICDFDEALALHRAASTDRAQVTQLLEEAEQQMTELGMAGWLRRVAELRSSL